MKEDIEFLAQNYRESIDKNNLQEALNIVKAIETALKKKYFEQYMPSRKKHSVSTKVFQGGAPGLGKHS